LHRQRREKPLAGKVGTMDEKLPVILPTMAPSTPLYGSFKCA
jgi:hypothetical protein